MFRATSTTLAGVSTSGKVVATPGGDIDTAAPLTNDINLIKDAGAVKLPPAIGGVGTMIGAGAGVEVFPELPTDIIGAGAAGAAFSQAPGATMYFCVMNGVWTTFTGGVFAFPSEPPAKAAAPAAPAKGVPVAA
jgi:hypothetical protein